MTLTETYTTELFPTADWQAFVKEREAEDSGKDWIPLCLRVAHPINTRLTVNLTIPEQRLKYGDSRVMHILRQITIEEWESHSPNGISPIYPNLYAARFV
jgi:hypothetical protein